MHSRHSLPYKRSRRGLTLVEVMLVLAVFSILMTAIFGIFQMGLSAWHKTNTKNELLQEVQITNYRLSRELEGSTLASLSSDPAMEIAAFLSAMDDTGEFVVDNNGRPAWQKYVVYYRNTSEEVIYRREVPLIPGASQISVPTPIEFYNPGGGAQPLVAYATGGQPLSRFVKEFVPVVLPAPVSELSWTLRVERLRYGSPRPESVSTRVATFLRN